MKTQKFEIVSTQSNIDWVGKKVTGAHNGTIAIKEGEINLNDGKLTGGKFIIDTTSIKILDVTDPATNAQFAGHLASDDFFLFRKISRSHFKDHLSFGQSCSEGDLTIKGITHPVGFDAAIEC
jgi:polyisoprenoid-binding protein YceI